MEIISKPNNKPLPHPEQGGGMGTELSVSSHTGGQIFFFKFFLMVYTEVHKYKLGPMPSF
jgi:hypothetical protein